MRQLQPGSAGRVLAVPADAVLFDLLSTKRLDHASERVRAEYAGGHTPDHADSGRNSITFNFLICDQQHQQRFDAKETSSTPFQLMRSCTTKKRGKRNVWNVSRRRSQIGQEYYLEKCNNKTNTPTNRQPTRVATTRTRLWKRFIFILYLNSENLRVLFFFINARMLVRTGFTHHEKGTY